VVFFIVEASMILYGSKNSRSVRATWALEEAGADYEFRKVNLKGGEGQSPAFQALNPGGKIPVLVDGELCLPESAAILCYVADRYPASGLLPTEAKARAAAMRWVFFACTELDAALWTIAKHSFVFPEDKRVPEIKPVAAWELAKHLTIVSAALQDGRDYIMGPQFCIADILLSHCLTWMAGAKLPLADAVLIAYSQRCAARPALARAAAREAAAG
jgi:glutathione S-transferase